MRYVLIILVMLAVTAIGFTLLPGCSPGSIGLGVNDRPALAGAACKHTKRTIIVNLDNHRHRAVLRHAWAAIADGQPRILHIDRAGADHNRDQSLAGVPSWGQLTAKQHQRIDPDHPNELHDRDEYPPAESDEGGKGADIRYVLAGVNRSAGAVMGAQLAPYCDGTTFRFEKKPGGHR
jgi:hypothetical protein